MFRSMRLSAALALAALAGLVPALRAQRAPAAPLLSLPRGNPYVLYATVYPNRYWSYITPPPDGSHLFGMAAYTRALGQYLNDVQRARLGQEAARQARFETRRKELELWQWERDQMPTPQDLRERELEYELRRSIDPPSTDIWSATALNHLLRDAQKIQVRGVAVRSAPISADVLRRVNVTSGTGGDIGLIKKGRLFWPLLLRRKHFEGDRRILDQLLRQAIEQAKRGEVEPETLEEMQRVRTRVERRLTELARANRDSDDWTPTLFIDSTRFLGQLKDTLRMLQHPDASGFLSGRYAARGKNVAELVKHMTDNGLRFAPAGLGDERAYTTLHRYLAAYVQGMRSAAGLPTTWRQRGSPP
jgi:hypothetical protein